jgi:hypothetical protein
MSSSRVKQLHLTISLIGKHYGEILLQKLEKEIPNIRNRSDASIKEYIYKIINYIDNVENSNYNIINNYTISEFEILWEEWFLNYKQNYNNQNYIETNEIILDCKNGFYWIKNSNLYSAEMIVRLDNCGRIPINHYSLELRENKDNFNYTHIVMVIDNRGIVHQIQGPKNEKPNSIYFKYIYELLINTNLIKNILSNYPDENEFRLKDFYNMKNNII